MTNIASCYRSPEIRPYQDDEYWVFYGEIWQDRPKSGERTIEMGDYFFYHIPPLEKVRIVNELIRKRSVALTSQHIPLIPDIGHIGGGALLVFDSDGPSLMGESQIECAVIGWDDTPAWDTWVYYSKGELISWIPSELLDQIQGAIDVNAVESLYWVEGPALESLLSPIRLD